MRRFIHIDQSLCTGCNQCQTAYEICPIFYEASGKHGQDVSRPGFLHCIYCYGDCTQECPQGAIMLVDTSGPHTVLCRDKNTNNFINMEE